MPNAKVLAEKQGLVKELVDQLKGAVAGVIVDYQGISVEQDTKLRAELRAAGVKYSVVKNTLNRLAFKEVGYDALIPTFERMSAIATSAKDPVAAAKILANYADKIETFNIKGGFVDGQVISVNGVTQLATLPSKEELIAKALGSLNAPISGFVNVLNGNLRGLAAALNAIREKKESEGA
ncbi:50S ribosomal protein L10 [Clostridia bacterium]|nr:50S ribosomal protein L10 [Clostridia bacterium]